MYVLQTLYIYSTDGNLFTKPFFSATPSLRWWVLGPDFFFHPVRSGVDGKRLGKDCFHGYGPTEIFWREGELFLDDFFLMVIGDWNCHYRHYGGRKMWSWSCIRRCSSLSVRLFPSKQNRKTVKMYLLV